DVFGREPAEIDDDESPAEALVVGVGEGGGRSDGVFGVGDVVGQALHDGLAPSAAVDIAGRGVAGFAVGADAEGVAAGGENGGQRLQDVGLRHPAGDAFEDVFGEVVGVVVGSAAGGEVRDGVAILVVDGDGEAVVEIGGVDGGLQGPGVALGVVDQFAVDEVGEGGGNAAGFDFVNDRGGERRELAGREVAEAVPCIEGCAVVGVGGAARLVDGTGKRTFESGFAVELGAAQGGEQGGPGFDGGGVHVEGSGEHEIAGGEEDVVRSRGCSAAEGFGVGCVHGIAEGPQAGVGQAVGGEVDRAGLRVGGQKEAVEKPSVQQVAEVVVGLGGAAAIDREAGGGDVGVGA